MNPGLPKKRLKSFQRLWSVLERFLPMTPFLDTSVLIRFQKTFRRLRELGDVKVPVVSVAEFARGIHETENPRLKNRAERFLSRQIAALPVVDFDFAAARAWAILVRALKDAGQTMKFGDSLIAAQCLAHNVPIVTSDEDFDRVPGLEVIKLEDLPAETGT